MIKLSGRFVFYIVGIAISISVLPSAYSQTKEIENEQVELSSATTDSARIFINYRLGFHILQAGFTDKAKKYFREGIQLSVKNARRKWEGVGLYFMGHAYFNQSRYDSSLYYNKKAIEAFDASPGRSVYYTYALNTIAAYYLKKGDIPNATKYAQKQLDVAIEVKDTSAIANSYTMFCAIADVMNDKDKTVYYSEKALELKRRSGNKLNLPVVLTNLAELYIHTGKARRAMSLLQEAAGLAREQNSVSNIAKAYVCMADVYNALQQYDSAYHYLKLARPMMAAVNDPQQTITMYDITSMVHENSKNYAAALNAVDSSIKLGMQYGLKPEVCRSYLRKTEVLIEAKDYKAALEAYQAYHALNDTLAGVNNKNVIAELEEKYESEKKDKEILFLDSTNRLNNERLYQQMQLYSLLRNETRLKDEKLKNEILLKQIMSAKLVEDSLLSNALTRENSLKENQLSQATLLNATLEKENILRQKDLGNEKKIVLLLLIGLAIGFISAMIVFIQYKKQKVANNIISNQSEKLTMLMKELHHRVKNNLQIVSSLLSLQSFRMKDEAAVSAVKEGQHRIEAMSLIHQRLYTNNEITEVNIKEFIADLAESLAGAYGYRNNSFGLRLDMEEEKMDVEKAIPLSLIINEIISNSFKYAYKETATPELLIRLRKQTGSVEITIADNGIGIDKAAWEKAGASFGKELIQTFTRQLKGQVSVMVNNGTQFKLVFPYN